eukprot:scaffold96534_cov30-Tisochrysis_lutea.AAC.1
MRTPCAGSLPRCGWPPVVPPLPSPMAAPPEPTLHARAGAERRAHLTQTWPIRLQEGLMDDEKMSKAEQEAKIAEGEAEVTTAAMDCDGAKPSPPSPSAPLHPSVRHAIVGREHHHAEVGNGGRHRRPRWHLRHWLHAGAEARPLAT